MINPWVDENGKPIVDPEDSEERYKNSQKLRAMERGIRKTKRQLIAKRVQLDSLPDRDPAKSDAQNDYDQLSLKLTEQNRQYNDFCRENDLQPQYSRNKVSGFDASETRRANQGAKRAYKKASTESGYADSVKTLADYNKMRYNEPERFAVLERYQASVKSGYLSPTVKFDLYEQYYNRIQNDLVGKTVNGVTITGQSEHFLERVFGCMEDPVTHRPRSGVELNDVLECVTKHEQIYPIRTSSNGLRSFLVASEIAQVSIDPDTGILIQTNLR